MPVTGDFDALRRLQARLDQARIRGGLLPLLTQRIAAAAVKQVADEFRESRDPYGKPWKPVSRTRGKDNRARRNYSKRRGGALGPARGDKPLVDTGRMAASVTAQPNGTTVKVTIGAAYAGYHQDGTKRIERRPMLPTEADGGIGPIWGEAFVREAEAVINQALMADFLGGK